jgi:hypothetical protein
VTSDDPASWTDLISESVHTSEDQDIGDIEAINSNFIVVKGGLVDVHRYYVSLNKVEGWDGWAVLLKLPQEQVKGNYERDTAPDLHVYYFSSPPTTDASTIRDFYDDYCSRRGRGRRGFLGHLFDFD